MLEVQTTLSECVRYDGEDNAMYGQLNRNFAEGSFVPIPGELDKEIPMIPMLVNYKRCRGQDETTSRQPLEQELAGEELRAALARCCPGFRDWQPCQEGLDPKLEEILSDPVMRRLCSEILTEPLVALEHLVDPSVSITFECLFQASARGELPPPSLEVMEAIASLPPWVPAPADEDDCQEVEPDADLSSASPQVSPDDWRESDGPAAEAIASLPPWVPAPAEDDCLEVELDADLRASSRQVSPHDQRESHWPAAEAVPQHQRRCPSPDTESTTASISNESKVAEDEGKWELGPVVLGRTKNTQQLAEEQAQAAEQEALSAAWRSVRLWELKESQQSADEAAPLRSSMGQ